MSPTTRICEPSSAVSAPRRPPFWLPLLMGLLAGCGASERHAPDGGAADTVGAIAGDTGGVAAGRAGRPSAADPGVAAYLARVDSAVFTRWGACPFECCLYGNWLAEGPVIVRSEPDSAGDILATVPAGERLPTDTGFVRITSAQLVVVTAPVLADRQLPGERWASRPDTLAPGDTLLVLEYLGEGYWILAGEDVLYSAEQFWPGEDGWQPHDGAKGRTVGTHRAEWWAHVTTERGVRGWIDAYGSELGSVDGCGM